MTIDELCDLAKERAGFRSDRELAKALGLNPSSVNFYRSKKAWPSETVVISLAKFAELDPDACVIELNIWRSKGPEAEIYQSILSRLKQTAAAFFLAFIVGVTGQVYVSDVQAKTAPTLSSEVRQDCILWKILHGWLDRLFRLIFQPLSHTNKAFIPAA